MPFIEREKKSIYSIVSWITYQNIQTKKKIADAILVLNNLLLVISSKLNKSLFFFYKQ